MDGTKGEPEGLDRINDFLCPERTKTLLQQAESDITEILSNANANLSYKEREVFDDEWVRVIAGSAKLNSLLRDVLESYFLPVTTTNDKLLDGRGALSTFDSRIRTAHRLGLIGADLFKTIQLIRRTRNIFAHESQPGGFTKRPHIDRVDEIYAPIENSPWEETLFSLPPSGPLAEFEKFKASMTVCFMVLELAAETIESLRSPETPYRIALITEARLSREQNG
jgi:DNA-binding MltR family transcriptional regulator